MKKIFILCSLFAFVCSVTAQSKSDVLLTINEKPVYKQEFVRVYTKNLDLVKDDSQKSVDGYLDLFVDYKLKVAEAYRQELDKEEAYQTEYIKYRGQLSRNFLFEEKIEEEMALEAYERMQEQINAAHVLIKVDYDAVPQDTLQAYNKALLVKQKAEAGEDFSSLAATYSEEPGAKERKGALGYFTAFSMLYTFETAAYSTPVGAISPITRTKYGYHVIKVLDRRPTGNEISVSHIMVADKKEDATFNAKERIDELYQLLQQGEKFEDVAKKYSDDKNSGATGGKLRPFTKGKLRSPKFEDAAFNLENPGDVSKPIQSSFGWHIIRLENISEQKSFDEMKERLIAQGNRGERLRIVATEIRSKIKDKYGFEKDDSYLKFFNSFVDKEVLNRRWKPDTTNANLNKVIFTIGDRDIYYRDFANYIETRHKRPMPKSIKTTEAAIKYIYDDFETATLQEYFRDSLEVENPEYAAIISEYREGLLIFEVMKRNIWDKARNDTLALQAYYEKNKGAYQWNERVDAALLTSTERQALLDSKKLLETGNSSAEVKQELNKDGKVRLLVSNGLFEKKNRNLPENFNFKKGVSEIYESEGNFTLVYVNEILPAGQKSFDEVKGNVMSEYQQILEEQWIQSLRDSNSVVINKKILKKIKKELN